MSVRGGFNLRLVSGSVCVRMTQGGALGDVILQLGAACYIAHNRYPVRIVSNTYCYESLRQMLKNESRVCPVHEAIEDHTHTDWPKMVDLNDPEAILWKLIGHPTNWYRQWEVPFSARWDYCPIERVTRGVAPAPESVIFVHDDPIRNQVINVDGYRPKMTRSILEHVPVLKAAREIHCMDSCFYHLVESMERPRAKLYFHAYVRAPYSYWPELPMRHDWTVLKTA